MAHQTEGLAAVPWDAAGARAGARCPTTGLSQRPGRNRFAPRAGPTRPGCPEPCRSKTPLARRGHSRPSMRFVCPTTHEAGGSDLRRVCLARLRGVSRFSRPPDAFFRLRPSGLVSCRWRPWAFVSSGLPSTVACSSSDDVRPPRRSRTRSHDPVTPGLEDLRTRGVRCSGPGVTRGPGPDPLLTFSPSEVSPSATSAPTTPTTSSKLDGASEAEPPFMGFITVLDGLRRPSPYLLCNVSKSRRGWPASFESVPPSMGFAVHA